MVVIEVCVGSSCHLKGSYDVVETFDQLINNGQLSDVVELRGVFCLEHCTQGVTVRIGDQIYSITTRQQAEELFQSIIEFSVRGDVGGDHRDQPSQL